MVGTLPAGAVLTSSPAKLLCKPCEQTSFNRVSGLGELPLEQVHILLGWKHTRTGFLGMKRWSLHESLEAAFLVSIATIL